MRIEHVIQRWENVLSMIGSGDQECLAFWLINLTPDSGLGSQQMPPMQNNADSSTHWFTVLYFTDIDFGL